jgi:hypothetical protein
MDVEHAILTGLDQSECDKGRSRRRVERKGIGRKGKRWKEGEKGRELVSFERVAARQDTIK